MKSHNPFSRKIKKSIIMNLLSAELARVPCECAYVTHTITKTCLFKYTEHFNHQKMKIFR